MQQDRGLVIVFTGNGKGKTTAALGVALRAQGRGRKTLFLQFMKGRERSGEQLLSETTAPLIGVHAFGCGFLKKGDDLTPHIKAAEEGWKHAEKELSSGNADILVLDEISHAINFGLLPIDKVEREIRNKRRALHLVLTGRNMPQALVDLADIVTEMKDIRHAYHNGLNAVEGIDF